MIKNDIVSRLKEFGLNNYEAKLWISLLSRGIAGASELSEIANVPRSRAYDVLESLEKKGFIMIKVGKPIKYMPISPANVLENLKKKLKSEHKEQLDQISNYKDSNVFEELNLLHDNGIDSSDFSDMSASLKGQNNLNNHIELCLKKAKDYIYLMTTDIGLKRKYDKFFDVFKKLKSRGVKINICAPLDGIDKSILTKLSTVANLKNIQKPISRFIVVDGTELTFMLNDDNKIKAKFDTGIWVNTPFFSNGLSKMFETVFDKN
ncbi:hypothetical protein HOK68_04955 [Candidatus Woesearchaeota archaeon]|jgi:HTH-type transcriptional regulator, sugar sensing transcriptional regulator|nr:hypothetical protein [Candidatus Woesearchaeota archaeon]MBT4387335.1 hypothetical protein [Candidatus Woesearchaeota archaeon]MBT4595474.1 hypothetical protein [Candidatus Woesearchaeota archaeon]MBT5740835.1 hypothetical protein [Candidatus Woesearchaeota archaeon]MBT6506097.1 hypothetical protein [Candidatus Woesearchaeota archaeon]